MIHAFLMEGEEELHDQVYDAVRAEIEQKPQRAGFGPWRELSMNKFLAIGLGAAAVVAVLLIGSNLLGGGTPPPGGAPSESAAPSEAEPSVEPSADSTPPPLTQSFTSTLHGITVSYPEGWTAQAATEPWTSVTFPLNFYSPEIDVLYDPDLMAGLFLTMASQPIGDATPEDWVAEQMASEEGCGSAAEPITVDGATGLGGADCSVAVVTSASRGYWIQIYTGDGAPATYDSAWFEEVLATVQLLPEDALDAAQ
jgi:hypothetical protein